MRFPLLPHLFAVGALVAALSGCGGPDSPSGTSGAPSGGPVAPAVPSDPAPRGDGRIDGRGLDPFDNDHAALTELDPALLRAVRMAATEAKADGVDLFVTSGWRSTRYQLRLFDKAVVQYGSREEAERYVLPPEKSAHVQGRAVDIGPTGAADWLGRRGAAFGLCQIYANEKWHFELAARPGGTCPRQLPDATAANP